MTSPYHRRMHPIRSARRRIEWFLTTDFDARDPTPQDKGLGCLIVIIMAIIYIWGGLK